MVTKSCSSRLKPSRFQGATAILAVCWAFLVAGTSLFGDVVDDYVENRRRQDKVPGISVAVVREGKVEKARGYGLADIELKVPATEDTVYQWASVTKQFTATAIMLLAQDGMLKLTDVVGQYYARTPAAWSNVTIRHLLTHTSGIRSYTDLRDFAGTERKDYEPDELIGLVTDLPLDFSPGEKWRYNNSAYFLLGLIIEKVSGKSYADFLEERIFKPLSMATARVNSQFELIPNRATGYANRSNVIMRAEFVSPSQPFSAGALVGTVLDLARWDAALYTDKVLPASVLNEMWTPVKLADGNGQPYGYGWQLGELRGHRFVGHGGGIQGFSTFILRMLDDKVTVVVLCNGGTDPQSIARGIAGRYVPGLTLASARPENDPDPALTQRLRKCLHELAETRDSDILTPEFRDNFSRSRRRHAALQEAVKDMTAFTYVCSETPKGSQAAMLKVPIARIAGYKIAMARGEPRFYNFALTRDNKLAGFETAE